MIEPTDAVEELIGLRRALESERRARTEAEKVARRATHRLAVAQQRLEAEQESLRSVVAAATHDIKNPMGAISGFVNLLEIGGLAPESHEEVLVRLRRSTNYCMTLVEGLLQVLSAGLAGGDPVPVALDELVRDVAAQATARHPDVQVETAELGEVLMPRNDVARLLDNLVENAARYAGVPQVRVVIDEVERTRSTVTLRIADNGRGVDAVDREEIFAIFRRGSAPQHHDGNGLGLAVCRRMAQVAGGDVWLDDRPGPDGGAAFLARLPRPEPDPLVSPPRS